MGSPNLANVISGEMDVIARECAEILEGKTTLADVTGYTLEMLEEIYERAYNDWNAGDTERATAGFAFLLLQQPLDRRFHFAFGCALKHQGEFRKALTYFGYATVMQANDPYSCFHIAECLQALNEIDAARDALDACIALCYGQIDNNQHYDSLRQRAENLLTKLNK